MATDSHRLAEELASQASAARARGAAIEARALYLRAAEAEEIAVRGVSPDRERTKGILGVSLVALLYKAREFGRAERWCFRLLGDGLPEAHERQVRELLRVVADERLLLEKWGKQYTTSSFLASIDGDEIGAGTAPFDVATATGNAVMSIVYRIAEAQGGFGFRTAGPPPEAVKSAVQARAVEAAVGSYRLGLRFAEPAQQDLIEALQPAPLSAQRVCDSLFTFLTRANAGDAAGVAEVVSQPTRSVLLKLVRNLLPAEGSRRIDFIRAKDDEVERVRVDRFTRVQVRQLLSAEPASAPKQPGERPGEVVGRLRGLHLDDCWLSVSKDEGGEQRCEFTKGEVLDDVVSPLVNQRVRVVGSWRTGQAHERFHMRDVESAAGEAG